jgi:membrane protein insertase Oxa1/YidC/SpoIIIJ
MTNKMWVAAWCGVAMFAVYFFSSLFNSILGLGAWSYAFVILSSIAWIGFIYGFVILGDKYKNGLVRGFAIYFIVLAVIVMILSIIAMPYLQGLVSYAENLGDIEGEIEALSSQYGGEENIPKEELEALTSEFTDFGLKMMKWFLIFYVFFFVLYGIPYIFFGIGLLKLSKDVELSKAAGIMNIVGGAATIIFIGAFLIFVAFILEIIILFKESGKKIKRR